MGCGQEKKSSTRELADIQGSPPPNSGNIHLNTQKISTDSRKPAWMSQQLVTKFRLKKTIKCARDGRRDS